MALLNQVSAVASMNLRSIPQRAWSSLATVIAVALVTGVLLGFLALANGFKSTMTGTGSDDVAIFIRKGAGGELNSVLSNEQLQLVAEGPGIARDAAGKPIVSGELYVIVDGRRRSSGAKGNLPFRGVGPMAEGTRSNVKITKGRMFTPGLAEIVVGKGIVSEFEGFDLDSTVKLGGQDWKVVGVIAIGSTIGGQIGAKVGRRLDPRWLRALIVVVGTTALVRLLLNS